MRHQFTLKYGWLACILLMLGSCASECDTNSVLLRIGWRDQADKPLVVRDTLTIFSLDNDSVIVNREVNISDFTLPLHYKGNVDRFRLHFATSSGLAWNDTLTIVHQNRVHFESTDCPMVVFHRIQEAHYQSSPIAGGSVGPDSLRIIHPQVNYEQQQNIILYMRPAFGE